ncbi:MULTISPECIES: ribosome recycling factor [Enterococcus]|jgi:ribosome recycling factor|uniref:Ribosome-recycling factor n=1 Tax=Enterococcus dispar ATCC 51266 TaxID=1139219 RepID=S1NVF3_9ENTE|nr:ribosome recycling factor [Enterococcus dispar]EOT42680.1 ribosome-recycling factor [Enterococcus dispar ATCC 51266]EOW84869.1 ribosome-recycling factor [Enterococcus dispar ATCC 51266]MCU7356186.1 ribosome recycling factor [Enterococcus dispar]MDT2704721.1 ribosome recycling factor [Enterococcus dispar]OJG38387.1 ribosome-recycling factor [Enterococcus dispar]
MADATMTEAKEKMQKVAENLQRTLGQIRAGRANAGLLDRVLVPYYGVPTPLNQMASIQTPEARVLLITPFDKSMIKEVEKALLTSDIGITPQSDGTVIRLVFPQLTEERRKELAKEVKKEAENAKIAVRNVRRDAMDAYKKQEKNSDITEDDLRNLEKDVQQLTDDSIKQLDQIAADKEKELLEV